jgi:hypothetical protein
MLTYIQSLPIPSSVPGNHNMLGPRRRRDRHNFSENQYTPLHFREILRGKWVNLAPPVDGSASFCNLYVGEPQIAACPENTRRDTTKPVAVYLLLS